MAIKAVPRVCRCRPCPTRDLDAERACQMIKPLEFDEDRDLKRSHSFKNRSANEVYPTVYHHERSGFYRNGCPGATLFAGAGANVTCFLTDYEFCALEDIARCLYLLVILRFAGRLKKYWIAYRIKRPDKHPVCCYSLLDLKTRDISSDGPMAKNLPSADADEGHRWHRPIADC
uniref:Uncharacterized protein n=1 Tax=Romanomermis culicivorax TaxID=13658 RepID=A0A915K390_ROMCU